MPEPTAKSNSGLLFRMGGKLEPIRSFLISELSCGQVPWREIRNRADRFSEKWQSKLDEEGNRFLEISHAQTFCDDFFEIFGRNRIDVALYEKNIEGNFIDCLWPGFLLIEWKRPGRNLEQAKNEVIDKYMNRLPESEVPPYFMVSDFKRFKLYDREANLIEEFLLSKLSENVKRFDFMINFNVTKKLQSKRVCDKDGGPLAKVTLRGIRRNARWCLLVSWTIGLGCGLTLAPMINASRKPETAFEISGSAWPHSFVPLLHQQTSTAEAPPARSSIHSETRLPQGARPHH